MMLEALANAPGKGSRLAHVAEATGLGKSTVLRLLKALIEVGYVEYDSNSKLYRLGHELFVLGRSARRFHIIELARAGLDRLAAETGDTVFLSVRAGNMAHCIDRRTGSYPIRTLTLSVGDHRPLGVGAGSLALLAFESDTEVAAIIGATTAERESFERFGDDELRAMIEATRQQGHAWNDGRIVAAMNAIGVPVLDAAGRVAAALSVAAIKERMTPERRRMIVDALHREAVHLGGLLDQRDSGRAPPVMELAE
jgi:DNA-binding IclR family transcriptional regulator